jgi:6-phosphogluconate dehydrogenase
MHIGIIGLGRMGLNMAKRLIGNGHTISGYNRSVEGRSEIQKLGAKTPASIEELVGQLKAPRVVWIMVPHGDPVTQVINQLTQLLEPQDIIIDGGNSHFTETIKRAHELKKYDLNFLDVGVSGGIFGLERGYCLMIGGDKNNFTYLEPIFSSLAPGEDAAVRTKNRDHNFSTANLGYYHCGPHGSGHFVKMVHNAIEYGIMQSYAEGLELLKNAAAPTLPQEQKFNLDIREITELWRRGSVIGSWLLDLMAVALHADQELASFNGSVPDSGEGRWALMEAIKQNTPAPNLANSLFTRFRSRQERSFAERALSALRKEFGGHSEHV